MKKRVAWILLLLIEIPNVCPAQQYGWTVIARPTSALGLDAVEFVDLLHGWCGGLDSIYRTTDGGKTWLHTNQPYDAGGIRKISFSDTLHGWAIGAAGGGIIWKTVDGGVTWGEQVSRPSHQYYGTVTQSSLRNTTVGAIYSGPDTAIARRTTNAGINWQDQIDSAKIIFTRISFVDSTHGWIIGEPSPSGSEYTLLRTVDGGESWKRLQAPAFHTLSFIDSLQGWGGGGGIFFRTTDGGTTWDSLYAIPVLDDFSQEALSFADTLNGWAFGDTFYKGIISEAIYRTTNGGRSWYRESVGLTDDLGILFDGKMLDQHHGWAVSGDGRVLSYQETTGIIEPPPSGVPREFLLKQNYPNPFNPTTTIEYELPERTYVLLEIFDLFGRKIKTLVTETKTPGVYQAFFNADDLATGVYFYSLRAGTRRAVKQMLFLK